MPSSCDNEHSKQTYTPALFARSASAGKWRLARHLALVDREVTQMIRGESDVDSLMVLMPPRHGKSEYLSKYLPTWFVGEYPDRRVLNCGYGNRFAESWGRKCRDLFAAHGPGYFGLSVSDGSSAASEWGIAGHDGGMLTAGIGGGITGRGAHLLIVDDPVKNAEEAASEVYRDKVWDWWQSTSDTRLEPGAKKIVIMTPWHNDDLSARLLKQAEEGGDPWRVIRLPAIAEGEGDLLGRKEGEALWPERWPIAALEKKRRNRSAYWWNALYQCRPSQHERAEFPGEYFGDHIWLDQWPAETAAVVVALDPSKGKNAKRGDYQAAVAVGVYHQTLIVDAILARVPIGAAVDNTLSLAFRYGARLVPYEANNFQEEACGPVFEDRLRGNRLHGIQVVPVLHNTSKEGRIQSLDPFLRNGSIRFVRSPGTKLLVSQLKEFPMAAHDDGPDALEMAIGYSLSLLNDQPEANPVQEILRARGYA